jgi:hypothetical protein
LPEKKEKLNANPSISWLRKILGGPISESTQEEWPELAKEWASAEVNMPRETSQVDRVGPMGSIERKLTKDATGRTNLGRISINRQAVTEDDNLRDTLVHELTHAGQKPRGLVEYMKSIMTPYEQRPEEQEAFEAEQNYPWKKVQRDRQLRSESGK